MSDFDLDEIAERACRRALTQRDTYFFEGHLHNAITDAIREALATVTRERDALRVAAQAYLYESDYVGTTEAAQKARRALLAALYTDDRSKV